jgi:hypothetical protein
MQNIAKYYTPKLKDFYVGFEYEKKEICANSHFLDEEWVDEICDFYDLFQVINDYTSDGIYSKEDYRVKTLSIECIKSLGWKISDFIDLFYNNTWCIDLGSDGYTDGYVTKFYISSHNGNTCITREQIGGFFGVKTQDVVFRENLKNKSELKKLMEQLNIK